MPTAKKTAQKIAFVPTGRDHQYLARVKRELRDRGSFDQTDQAAIKLALALAYEKLGKVSPKGRKPVAGVEDAGGQETVREI